MKRLAKIGIIGFGIAAVVIAIAVSIFASTFDINDYKTRIIEAVNEATGRTLTVKGPISLTFFPTIGVQFQGLSLSNAKGFGTSPMVQTAKATVSVRILPLLAGNIQFGQLSIDDLTLRLSRNKDGAANWDDLVGRDRSKVEMPASDEFTFDLDVDGVSLKNARFEWDDLVYGTHFTLHNISLKSGRVYEGAPIPVQAAFDFDCTEPESSGHVTLTGKSSFDLANREYGHMDVKATIEGECKYVPGGKVKAELGVQFAALDFNDERAQVSGLTLSMLGATVHVDGTLNGLTSGVKKIAATMSVDPFNVREAVSEFGLELPEMHDPSALAEVGGMADVVYEPRSLSVKSFESEIDGTRLTGSAQLKLTSDFPYLFARIDGGKVDLDRYFPPNSETASSVNEESQEEKQRDEKQQGEPLRILRHDWVRKLHLDVAADIAELKLAKVHFQAVKVAAKADNEIVHVSPIRAQLYGGTLAGNATINAQGDSPFSSLFTTVENVDVSGLFSDVVGSNEYKGTLNMEGELSFSGEHLSAMLETMAGKGRFDFINGVFPGVDLIGMAKRTHASKGKKKGELEAKEGAVTRYGSISGTSQIVSGVAYSKDLVVKAPGLWVDGEGMTVLATQELDFLLKVKLVPLKHEDVESSDELWGVLVPIRVGGTIGDPHYWVSLTEYVKSLGGAVISLGSSVVGGVFDTIKGIGSVFVGSEEDEKQQ